MSDQGLYCFQVDVNLSGVSVMLIRMKRIAAAWQSLKRITLSIPRVLSISTALPITVMLFIATAPSAFAESYMSQDQFLQSAFGGKPYTGNKLWLTPESKAVAREILKHDYNALRVRYWESNGTTAWILDEVGKKQPITIGVVVDNAKIKQVNILEFRESRGWEVRYPFFTDQFQGVYLNKQQALSENIDGVSGATLSVRAVKKIAALSLYLDSLTAAEQ